MNTEGLENEKAFKIPIIKTIEASQIIKESRSAMTSHASTQRRYDHEASLS